MNKMYPNEAPTLNINCVEFDGNGIIIKNGRYNSNVIKIGGNTINQVIKNINIINFLLQNDSSLINTYYGNHVFYDCTFSGKSVSSKAIIRVMHNGEHNYNFYRCGFNLEVTNNQYFCAGDSSQWSYMYFRDTHIIYQGNKYASMDCHGSPRLVNSLLEGSLDEQLLIPDSHDSIVNMICPSIAHSDWDTYSHVIYNSSKSTYSGNKFIGLTDLELQDAQVIAATGFPIGVD